MLLDEENSMNDAKTMRFGNVPFLGRVDQYELIKELGTSSYNKAYLARDTASSISVVIKSLPSVIESNDEANDMFKRWFSKTSRLHHPGIASLLLMHKVKNIDFIPSNTKPEIQEGSIIIISALTNGVQLSQLPHKIKDRSVLISTVLKIARQLALAIDYAHSHGVRHGYLRSDNIFVDGIENNELSVRIVDFGYEALQTKVLSEVTFSANGREELIPCNRSYFAPEQWLGNFNHEASDQYALAAIIYELLVGTVPFSSAFALADNLVAQNAVMSVPPEIPDELPAAVRFGLAKALAKKPEERFVCCAQFVDALEGKYKEEASKSAVSHGAGRSSRGVNVALSIIAILGLGFAGSVWYWHDINVRDLKNTVLEQKKAIESKDLEINSIKKKVEEERLAREAAEKQILENINATNNVEEKIKLLQEEKAEVARKAAEELKTVLKKAEENYAKNLGQERVKLEEQFSNQKNVLSNELVKFYKDEQAKYISKLESISERASKAEAKLLALRKKDGGSDNSNSGLGKSAPKHGDTKTLMLPGGVGMELIYVAPGNYVYGEDRTKAQMDHGFWLGKYEVTQRQWQSVMGENPSYFKGDDLPVDTISWDDCQRFVGKLNASLDCGAKLPTEREWEYACRAESKTEYSWGDALNGDKANCDGTYPVGTKEKGVYLNKTVPVNSYSPNQWGFYCMHGNVREWCQDVYDSSRRVLRGGSWYHSPSKCKSATRDGSNPASRYSNFGFRICCTQ